MEMPELADLIWLFEDEPTPDHEDLSWPVGLQSFRLRRGDRAVLFSLDPTSGEAYLRLFEAGEETASIGRLRKLESLTTEKRGEYEGLIIKSPSPGTSRPSESGDRHTTEEETAEGLNTSSADISSPVWSDEPR